MWLYTIRADNTYVPVHGLLEQVVAEGRAFRSGYTPEQADVVDRLLRTTVITSEAEVIVHYVAPANIVSAQRLHYTDDGTLYEGAPISNPNYQPLDTAANSQVASLQSYVPTSSIRLELSDDSDTNSSCSMSCDGAGSPASSMRVSHLSGELPLQCYGRPKLNWNLINTAID